MTVDTLQSVLPAQVKRTISQALVDEINKAVMEPEMREIYRDNVLGYCSVMQDGRFKIADYLSAVRYVSFKVCGDTNLNAYTKAFPDRYQALVAKGTAPKDIASYVAAYNKNKLVNLVMAQTLVPTHVLNADLFQKAINVQADLMTDDNVSPKVRSDAANSLMTHLKAPETKKVELDIGIKQDKSIQELREVTMGLVAEQRKMLESGQTNAKDVAHSVVIDAPVIEVDE